MGEAKAIVGEVEMEVGDKEVVGRNAVEGEEHGCGEEWHGSGGYGTNKGDKRGDSGGREIQRVKGVRLLC